MQVPSSNGRWTDEEHDHFIDALRLFGKNWNKVHRYVGTRTSAQTRSHAQKYFNKLLKRMQYSKEGLSKEALEHLSLIGYGIDTTSQVVVKKMPLMTVI
jgi:SHAQKYF class myb-like DNA-binding protein